MGCFWYIRYGMIISSKTLNGKGDKMPDIGILNFDNTRYFISEPNDIYWFGKRFSFNAVLYIEDKVIHRDRFYSICDEFCVYAVYGLKLKIRLSSYADKTLDLIVCPIRQGDTEVSDYLSAKSVDGVIALDDVLSCRDKVRIGITLGENDVDIGSIYGISRYLIKPDFVFVRYDVMMSDCYEEFSDGAFFFMQWEQIVVIPQMNLQENEHWRYLFDDVNDAAQNARRRFLQLFERRGN